jgi:hypothetical protein
LPAEIVLDCLDQGHQLALIAAALREFVRDSLADDYDKLADRAEARAKGTPQAEKRQTEDQVAAFAKKAAQQNEFHRSRRDPSQKFRRDPYQKLMGWLLPRAGKS